MMMKYFLAIATAFLFTIQLAAQCGEILVYDQVDEFDSTRVVTGPSINIGYMVPSNFQTLDGFKMVEEAKLLFGFTRQDTVNAFFVVLAVAEREYYSTENGDNVLFKIVFDELEDVVGFYTASDRGVFDPDTNMRIYHHTSIVPVDSFYKLTNAGIERIRVYYENYKHTIVLTAEQQAAIRAAVRCVGEAAKLYPVRP